MAILPQSKMDISILFDNDRFLVAEIVYGRGLQTERGFEIVNKEESTSSFLTGDVAENLEDRIKCWREVRTPHECEVVEVLEAFQFANRQPLRFM